MRPLRLRLVALAIGDLGLILTVLTFVFRLGLGSTVSLIGITLMVAGVTIFLGLGALKAKDVKK